MRKILLVGVALLCLSTMACMKKPTEHPDPDPDTMDLNQAATAALEQEVANDSNSSSSDSNSADDQLAPGDPDGSPNIGQRKKNLFVGWDEGTYGNLLVDNENGCEYIQDEHNTFPRMDHGKQICRDDNRDPYWVKAHQPGQDKSSDDDKPKVKH